MLIKAFIYKQLYNVLNRKFFAATNSIAKKYLFFKLLNDLSNKGVNDMRDK